MLRQKKEVVAMVLAGGQGSRLKEMTENIAKPAVAFGGKYRIIDFTLSNCSNSDMEAVGVLTQYQPFELNAHIGNGSPWDLDRIHGGVSVLPPYVGRDGGRWYKGTANAIYENMDFIDSYEPDYVLILSGDHIYKMDYSMMLEYHKEKGAEATISVIKVPWEETYRFGIMNVDEDNRIYEFEEKPKNAKSNLASMGIYIFDWKVLKEYLVEDEKDENSKNDFGKNIIPKMVDSGLKVYTYNFDGYWKDVGTIESFWEANMDLLKDDSKLDLYDRKWKIYSVNPHTQPHYISSSGEVKNSLLNEGCIVHGKVEGSVLFTGAYVGENAKVIDSVIMPGAKIEDYAIIEKTIVMEDTVIKAGSKIGDKDSAEVEVINKNNNSH
ncbi:glucose-1-phosphate adenylyltransferase [Anaeromicrobium sediminis]|uniref:Glucose-1-phosphate adenylyltransferase n=1 Tax=Anaeromicrobium sediminis TaxID=1478221 RepID=A0A267MIN5_9FIRM|nr:glucose-1-phosphate adenylyltransferase [Anaeromicrobium sediminis]PAB58788.1 glucose-1-phosphate adenylyltransferase [Anaeromicrobium sediminis]